MKFINVEKATNALGDYARKINGDVIVLVDDGTPVAALMPLANCDMESVRLATSAEFQRLIQKSRQSAQVKGHVSHQRVWAEYEQEQSDLAHVTPLASDYAAALEVLEESMPPNHRKLLVTHYRSPKRTSTAARLAKAVGYKQWGGANLQYGALAKRVGDVLCFHPDPVYHIAVLVTWKGSPGEHLNLTMRPQVAQALEKLGWV